MCLFVVSYYFHVEQERSLKKIYKRVLQDVTSVFVAFLSTCFYSCSTSMNLFGVNNLIIVG